MPSTTVHLPDKLLNRIDQVVNEIGISRNKFIIKACQDALQKSAGRWPAGFFEADLSASNLRLLKEGVSEMEAAIMRMRKNRREMRI